MKSILFLAAVVLCTNAVLHVSRSRDHTSDLVETENGGFDDQGHELYQRDMVLDEEQKELLNNPSISKRKVINGDSYRWPNAQVQYRLDASSEGDRVVILQGMHYWEENTCVRFIEVPADYSDPHLIFKKLNGCWSNVGRMEYKSGQEISIGSFCESITGVAHELGHALGFYHEQSRPDRDKHVVVLKGNVKPGEEQNFKLETDSTTFGIPYDFKSIMQYGSKLFAKDYKNSLVTKDPLKHFQLSPRNLLSFGDIRLTNFVYNCAENCTGVTCVNGGFVVANCSCVCPEGFFGATCQEETLICGGNITQPTIIESPNYPNTYPAGAECVWVFTAPAGQNVRAQFNHFKLEDRWDIINWCVLDIFELRIVNLHDGKAYCGNELQGRNITSASNTMVFVFSTAHSDNPGTGFQVQIDFV